MTAITTGAAPATRATITPAEAVEELAGELRHTNPELAASTGLRAAAATILLLTFRASLPAITEDPRVVYSRKADRARERVVVFAAMLGRDFALDAVRLRLTGIGAVAHESARYGAWLSLAGTACALAGATLSAGPLMLHVNEFEKEAAAWWVSVRPAICAALRIDADALDRLAGSVA